MFFIGVTTITNFIYFAVVMVIPPLRAKLVLFNIDRDRNVGSLGFEIFIIFYNYIIIIFCIFIIILFNIYLFIYTTVFV